MRYDVARIGMMCVAVVLVGWMLPAPDTAWSLRVGALVTLAFAWSASREFLKQLPSARKRVFHHAVWFVRRWRSYARTSSTVLALYYLSFGLALVGVALVLCRRDAGHTVTMGAGALFASAGCLDIMVKLQRILRAAWAPAAGKLLAVSMCVGLAAAALSLAKESAHTLSHIDPKYLPEFTAILAVCMLPIVYGTALMTSIGIYGLVQLVILGAFMMVTTPMHMSFGGRYRDKTRMAWFRVLHGKRPAGNILPPPKAFAVDDLPYFAKPLGTLAVAAVFGALLQSVIAVLPAAEPTLTTILVRLEYRKASSCTNISRDLPVAYMENGLVSVALPHERGVRFEVRQCDLLAPHQTAEAG